MQRKRLSNEGSTDGFTPIGPTRCAEMLESQSIGRVAWTAADGLQILPVTYACHDGTIIFRTSPYGVLSELIRPTDVALEIDELDQERRRVWSVVVQGRAQGVAEPAQLVRMWTVGGVVPWASGVRNVFIQIIPQRITGRVLAADPSETTIQPTTRCVNSPVGRDFSPGSLGPDASFAQLL